MQHHMQCLLETVIMGLCEIYWEQLNLPKQRYTTHNTQHARCAGEKAIPPNLVTLLRAAGFSAAAPCHHLLGSNDGSHHGLSRANILSHV